MASVKENQKGSPAPKRAHGETRELILKAIRETPRTVSQLAGDFKISGTAVAYHLAVLREQGFVKQYVNKKVPSGRGGAWFATNKKGG